jgi:hypothetical protein
MGPEEDWLVQDINNTINILKEAVQNLEAPREEIPCPLEVSEFNQEIRRGIEHRLNAPKQVLPELEKQGLT